MAPEGGGGLLGIYAIALYPIALLILLILGFKKNPIKVREAKMKVVASIFKVLTTLIFAHFSAATIVLFAAIILFVIGTIFIR